MAKAVERSFSVLLEEISRDNVQAMSELLTLIETKWLIGRVGELALRIHQRLYGDVVNKDVKGYVLTDSYDIVQTVALFLCEHIGERLDDYCYSTRNGKAITIKYHCYRIIERAVCTSKPSDKHCMGCLEQNQKAILTNHAIINARKCG